MRKYLVRLLIVSVIVILACAVLKRVFFYGLDHYSANHEKFNYVFRDTGNQNILLLGSSRMKNMVNPKVLDSITHFSSYNAGAEGASMIELEMIFNSYLLSHPPPKILVVNLDYFALHLENNYIGFYQKYLEFVDIKPIAGVLKKQGIHTQLYKFMPFLEMVELDDYNKGAVLKVAMHQHDLNNGDFFYKGYESNTLDTMSGDATPPAKVQKMEAEAKIALNNIVNVAEEKGIKILFTYAPEYHHDNAKGITNFKEIMEYYQTIATRNKIPFLRNDQLSICDDNKLFANAGHLNRIGADVYSKILASQLDSIGYLGHQKP